jgi:hypothetical protein
MAAVVRTTGDCWVVAAEATVEDTADVTEVVRKTNEIPAAVAITALLL